METGALHQTSFRAVITLFVQQGKELEGFKVIVHNDKGMSKSYGGVM